MMMSKCNLFRCRMFIWHAHFLVYVMMVTDFKITASLQLLPLRHKLQKNLRRSPRIHTSNDPVHHKIYIPIPLNAQGDDIQKIVDEHLMGLALEQAREAGDKYGEVPIGAIVVEQFQDSNSTNIHEDGIEVSILSHGQNQIETKHDASAHAETQSLRSAAKAVQNWRLLNATLYSTLEPCPMCLSAAQAFRVKRIVYGAPDLRLGAVETYMNLLDYPHPFHSSDAMEVIGGVRAEEAKTLLVDFFRARRKKGKRKKTSTSQNGHGKLEANLDMPEKSARGKFSQLLNKIRKK
jgi:tRNA(adenine34) deaminase